MKLTNTHILVAALAAGALGVLASLWFGGSPLLRTDPGQRALQAAMDATTAAPPAGVTPAKPGEPMPPIALPDLQGQIQELPGAHAGRPLLINVWASWCGPCRQMAPEFAKAAAQLEPRMRLGKLDTEAEPAIATRYNIRSIPTMVLIRNGREIARQSGAMPASSIVQWASSHL